MPVTNYLEGLGVGMGREMITEQLERDLFLFLDLFIMTILYVVSVCNLSNAKLYHQFLLKFF